MPGPPLNFRSPLNFRFPLNLEKISGDPQNFRPEIFRRPLKIGGGAATMSVFLKPYNFDSFYMSYTISQCHS